MYCFPTLEHAVATVWPVGIILNWTQTRVKVVPSYTWTMEERGAKYAEIIAVNDKCQITPLMVKFAMKILCPLGIVLPVQLTSMGCPLDISPSLTRIVPLSCPCSPPVYGTDQGGRNIRHILRCENKLCTKQHHW